MKSIMKNTRLAMAILTAATLWAIPMGASGGNAKVLPPNSTAYGKSLTEWLTTYWQWWCSGADSAQSQVGKVQLLPLPEDEAIGGSGTPDNPTLLRGTVEVTLRPGTPLVLPIFAFIYERYAGWPEVEDDPLSLLSEDAILGAISPSLTIDGKPVITDANKAAFFIPPTPLDPVVNYPEQNPYSGSIAAVGFSAAGIVSPPLSVGVHTIHLDEPYILRATDTNPFAWGYIYDHTWIVTVTPH